MLGIDGARECIVDNVGDNLGDMAAVGADLFGSFAEATCPMLVLVASSGVLEKFGFRDSRCLKRDLQST